LRLESIARLHEFDDKIQMLTANLNEIKIATRQARNSQSFRSIVEFILAIGNHLNENNSNLCQAQGFRLNILPQLDQIKVNGSESSEITFLNLLAYLCSSKYGDNWFKVLNSELDRIENASKGNRIIIKKRIYDYFIE
jgi:hypothetical protein